MTERDDSGQTYARGRTRSRSTSPPRRMLDEKNQKHGDRVPFRSSSRSRSPNLRRRRRPSLDSHSRSSSRSNSPRRDRHKDGDGKSDRRDRRYKRRSRTRSRSRNRSRTRHSRRRRSRSSSSSSSSSTDIDRQRKKRRKDKHRKRSNDQDRDRERKEKKKAKKDKKKKKKGTTNATAQWGKYGIIKESDMYDKEAEFRTWLVEERMINPETLSKEQTKKEFARFAEDYNTATLPHEKYYDITSYERRMSLIRSGETLPPTDTAYDVNADIRAHTSAVKKSLTSTSTMTETEKETYMNKEQLQELRRVQQERHQVAKMKLMGMNIGQSFGVRMDGNEFEG